MAWVDVDNPTKRYTVHATNCTDVINKDETREKGVGKLKKDGGWLKFNHDGAMRKFYSTNYPDYNYIDHC